MRHLKMILILSGLLVSSSQLAYAESARVACQNTITGSVTIHNGNCPFGEQLVKVLGN